MIDYVLLVLLVGVMPARALYKSLRGARPEGNRSKTYLSSGAIILGLLVVLCYAWLHANRAPALLGLETPVSERSIIGLGIAVVLFIVLAIVEVVAKHKRAGRNNAKARQRLESNELLPRNRHELILFLGFGLLAGCGWELLYRGFLIWFLVPRIGMVGAICLAALTYGVAHGYKTRGQFVGSIISAFAFTIAFVLSGSLWWLMLIHTMAALVGGISSYKLLSKESGDATAAGIGAPSS